MIKNSGKKKEEGRLNLKGKDSMKKDFGKKCKRKKEERKHKEGQKKL